MIKLMDSPGVLHSLCVLLCLVFFLVDISIPLGFAGGTLYVIVVILAGQSSSFRTLMAYTVIVSLLTLVGYFLSQSTDAETIAIINRVVSILVNWVCAYFCYLFIQSNNRLGESEAFTRQIFESAPNGQILVDKSGTILEVNAALEKLFGYKSDEMVGQDVSMLVPRQYRNDHASHVRDYQDDMSERKIASRDGIYGVTKSGNILPMDVALKPFKSPRGQLVIASVVDISERKRQLKLLADANVRLASSNRELEQFAYVASHDLQEPLRMVSSYTQLLASRYKDKLDEDANEFIDYAVDGAKRMQVLINDLLQYSRIGIVEEKLVAVDLNEICDYALKNLEVAIEESNTVIEKDELPVVIGEAGMLRQLFQNLIGNAVKYRSPERQNHVKISSTRKDGLWQISIEDNGIGIEKDYFDKIFIIFKRLHNRTEYEGTGIGLTICKKVVESLGGELWLESEKGKGTSFHFTIPT